MLTCTECGRDDFTKPQGLNGHLRMVHGVHEKGRRFTGRETDSEAAVELENTAWLIGNELKLRLDEQKEISGQILTGQKELVLPAISKLIAEIGELKNEVEEIKNRHVPGFCEDDSCKPCRRRISQTRSEVIAFIEKRLPGTSDLLRQIKTAVDSGDAGQLPLETSMEMVKAIEKTERVNVRDSRTSDIVQSMFPNG